MHSDFCLSKCCHVSTNNEGDRFVGVKVNSKGAIVWFPLGYDIPKDEHNLRLEIVHLLNTIYKFKLKSKQEMTMSRFSSSSLLDDDDYYPMCAYLKIIQDFLRHGHYYTETETKYKTDTKGCISWARTIRHQLPLRQNNGSLILTNFTVRSITPNSNNLITQIHRYCVYEAFEKLGWLYLASLPEKPSIKIEHQKAKAIYILEKKLTNTNNDEERELLSAMKAILLANDMKSKDNHFTFGTYKFEYVWEGMINSAFGIENIKDYFPRTHWSLDYGDKKSKRPLRPDSIMKYCGKIYILDAKYYKYGCDLNPDNLPNTADIQKQITYGEYIENKKNVNCNLLYNAFIMPFNHALSPFKENERSSAIITEIGNIGEAISEWRPKHKYYERVQGIVIDTRFLMLNYLHMPKDKKKQLAESIEKVNTRGPVSIPL